MHLENTCADVNENKWEQLMANAKPYKYSTLVNKIKKDIPILYKDLDLKMYNPYHEHAQQTKTHYILVHSAIEYFIRK